MPGVVLGVLLILTGLIIFVADDSPLPGVLILVAAVVFLLGAAGFGIEATREARAGGDNWLVAVWAWDLGGHQDVLRVPALGAGLADDATWYTVGLRAFPRFP